MWKIFYQLLHYRRRSACAPLLACPHSIGAHADGMARGGNAPLREMILYDRIEVVRGATGLMGGTGDPSATINMIRKRPTKEFQASAGLIMGRWDDQRVEADLSTPLNTEGSVRARTALAWPGKNAIPTWTCITNARPSACSSSRRTCVPAPC